MAGSLLSRVSASTTGASEFTFLQTRVDGMVSAIQDRLFDSYNVASWLIGAAAYGAIRYGAVRKAESLIQEAAFFEGQAIEPGIIMRTYPIKGSQGKGFLMGSLEVMAAQEHARLMAEATMFQRRARFFALGSFPLGIVAGSTTYEMAHRGLLSIVGNGSENANLWSWGGDGGIKNGLIRSSFVFGGSLFMGEIMGRGGFLLMKDNETILRPVVTGAFAVSGFTGSYLGFNKFATWFSEPKAKVAPSLKKGDSSAASGK
jgi:hypothetical protein